MLQARAWDCGIRDGTGISPSEDARSVDAEEDEHDSAEGYVARDHPGGSYAIDHGHHRGDEDEGRELGQLLRPQQGHPEKRIESPRDDPEKSDVEQQVP